MPKESLDEIKSQEDPLDQSIALNRIVLTMMRNDNKKFMIVVIALIVSILVNLISIGAFLWYENQWNYQEEQAITETVTTTTTTETIDQDVSGDSAEINNVEGNQYKDSATHNEGVKEGE